MLKNNNIIAELESGKRRAACKIGSDWIVDIQVKEHILELIRSSNIVDMPGGFRDKEALKPRVFTHEHSVRLVPGGSSVRPGTYVGDSVVIMPPSFINIGAHVGSNSMIDSNVLVGSCAQIGRSVHLSAGVQIGGVLEPIGTRPVIIEDSCFIGAGSVLTEGILVKQEAVVAPGVFLSASVPIYDIINNKIYKGEIPEKAVVVAGSRPLENNAWAARQGLLIACAVIIKYRDDKTSASLILEKILRK